MSIAEVQQRTSEIAARLQQLSVPPQGASFAGLLARASAPVPASAAAPARSPFAPADLAGGAVTGPPATQAPATAGPSSAPGRSRGAMSTTGEDLVAKAKTQLGTPYVWGAEDPGGFDCSGLVQWTYKQFGIDLPRVSRDQAKVGRAVSPAEAQPGDLVFFDRKTIDHIGIYAGKGQWVVAPKTGDVVKMQNVDLDKASTIRRVLPPSAGAPATAGLAGLAGLAGAAGTPGWSGALPPQAHRYTADIAAAAKATGVDARLIAAVAWSESGFNPTAKSPAGAVGLMQLMPRTAAGLGVDPTDPKAALLGGARYLAQQLTSFGTPELALAAYNAGPGAVRKHGGIPPYQETQKYVTTVLSRYRQLGGTT